MSTFTPKGPAMTKRVSEIKNCPFCGKPPEVEGYNPSPGTAYDGLSGKSFRVHCVNPNCPAQGWTRHYRKRHDAITVWNRRVMPPEVERLMKFVESELEMRRNCKCPMCQDARAALAALKGK